MTFFADIGLELLQAKSANKKILVRNENGMHVIPWSGGNNSMFPNTRFLAQHILSIPAT
jgi:hypothetical protein